MTALGYKTIHVYEVIVYLQILNLRDFSLWFHAGSFEMVELCCEEVYRGKVGD